LALVPFSLFYSEQRHDNFTTATEQGRRDAEAAGYRFVRDEGLIYNEQVPAGVPLRLYYSEQRHDNFTTATEEGRRDAEAAGYRFVRIEGYTSPP
jgi:hypothetical protein